MCRSPCGSKSLATAVCPAASLRTRNGSVNIQRVRVFTFCMVPEPARAYQQESAPGSALGAPGPDGSDEAGAVRRFRKRGDLDHVAGVRGLDESAAADVDPLGLWAAGARMEEEEVAGLQLPRQHGAALLELGTGVVGQANAELCVDV